MQNIKTIQIFTSRNFKFDENNQPGFHNETQEIGGSFLYLDLDELREEPQIKNNLSELSSEVESIEIESVQESENNTETEVEQEIKQERPSPSVKPKSKINVQLNPKVAVQKKKAFKHSSTCLKLTTEKSKITLMTANDW